MVPAACGMGGLTMRIVVAVGGNALLERGEVPDAQVQRRHVQVAAPQLVELIHSHTVVLCHGNGPQIGVLATESEDDAQLTHPYPLDVLGAQTQGMIGYWLSQELASAGTRQPIAALITQTVVDPDDAAFSRRPSSSVPPSAARRRWRSR